MPALTASSRTHVTTLSPLGSAVAQPPADAQAQRPDLAAAMDRMAPYRELASQVILYRTRHHLTQEQLAERMGTSASVIARIESGNHRPSIETARRIAEALHVRLRISFEEWPRCS